MIGKIIVTTALVFGFVALLLYAARFVRDWSRKNLKNDDEASGEILAGAFVILLLLAVVIVGLGSWFQVKPGHTALIVNQFDGVEPQSYGPGIHLKMPLFETDVEIETRQQSESVPAVGASRDLQEISVEVSVLYSPADVAWLYDNIGIIENFDSDHVNVDKVLPSAVQEAVKACIAPHLAEDLIRSREVVRDCIDEDLKGVLREEYRIAVHQVLITDFDFSEQFNSAIESRKVNEQQLEAQRAISQKAVVEASAQYQVELLRANATRAQADAEAYKASTIQEALNASPAYLDYLRVSRWNGVLPNVLAAENSADLLVSVP